MPAGSDDIARTVLDVLPEKRTQVYDVRRIIERIADKDSVFELKARFGKTATTALARLSAGGAGIEAHLSLATARILRASLGGATRAAELEDARSALERASRLDPEHPELSILTRRLR